MAESPTGSLFLTAVSGPAIDPIELQPKSGGVTIGRHAACDVLLPADAEKVSRFHARFLHDGEWRILDLNSRWGTFLNGIKLEPDREMPLSEGDLIRISPWTFSVSTAPTRIGIVTRDDAAQTFVRTITGESSSLKNDILGLLLESAAAIHSAANEQQLAERLMDASLRGTGLSNAVMLRPLDTNGRVEVIASSAPSGSAAATFSKSLIAGASRGNVAELSGSSDSVSQSIVQMNISAALCVPLMLGSEPAAYLYLDSRGGAGRLRPNASDFCVALGRIGSLALANIKRIDIERRHAQIESELSAAAAAQKWVLPKRHSQIGPFSCLGESRPGRYLGGDFFDLIGLGHDRLAITVGDVTGKGVTASVLMTATQGFLHAALREHGDAGRAVTGANEFIFPRRPEGRFVTVWVGVFDRGQGTLNYVDAGHSYAVMQSADGPIVHLNSGDGLPIGVDGELTYRAESLQLPESGRAVVVSDGIIEQFSTAQEQFGMGRISDWLGKSETSGDAVAEIFSAVIAHAGSDHLSDDATAVVAKW